MKKLTIYLLILLLGHAVCGQQMERVASITDSLCAPYMHGRGYTHKGDLIAASFIEKHFITAGLHKFKNAYFQHFEMQVNTFPTVVDLAIDGKTLRTGKDFIAHSLSGSGKGKAKVWWISREMIEDPSKLQQEMPSNLPAYAIAYNQQDEPALLQLPRTILVKLFMAKLHLSVAEKLTHSIASQQYDLPKVVVLKEAWKVGTSKISYDIHAQVKSHISQNVAGYIKGASQPDSFVVFTAHYDHLGAMGSKVYFPGANDNASGVAMLLELAYHYAANPPAYSVVFIAFGAEEAGLIGSKHYVDHPLFPLSSIRFLINIDLMATGEKGVTAVNATEFTKEFALLQQINQEKGYLSEVKPRGPAANSDHHFFYAKGVPCFFLYLMGGWPHYHDVDDRFPVPYTEFQDTFKLLVDFTGSL